MNDFEVKLDKSTEKAEIKLLLLKRKSISLKNAFYMTEDIISEVVDRKSRKSNIIVYYVRDSVDANSTDVNKFREIL